MLSAQMQQPNMHNMAILLLQEKGMKQVVFNNLIYSLDLSNMAERNLIQILAETQTQICIESTQSETAGAYKSKPT